MDRRRGRRRYRGRARETAQLAHGEPTLPAFERDHHTSCRVLLRGVDRNRSADCCRRGCTRPEWAACPLTGQQNCGLEDKENCLEDKENYGTYIDSRHHYPCKSHRP